MSMVIKNKTDFCKPYKPIFIPVGKKLKVDSVILVVMACSSRNECTGCHFNKHGRQSCRAPRGLLCTAYQREDNISVKFIKHDSDK